MASPRPTLAFEIEWQRNGHARVAGVDEAGVGPLAGPVCAAAVVLPEGFEHAVLHDSKQLTEKKRDGIYDELTTMPGLVWSVSLGETDEIDRINILQATRAAMRRAVLALKPRPDAALIDGRAVRDFPVPSRSIVKGDALSLSIAAASVIAKVTRDRIMLDAALRYPEYGFERHKGYGTRDHLAALRQHGPCPLHRRSFAPVAQLSLELEGA